MTSRWRNLKLQGARPGIHDQEMGP
jgi:hypothetical protein